MRCSSHPVWPVVWLAMVLGSLSACGSEGEGETFFCPDQPVAYVYDPDTSALAVEALESAGFAIETLPLDRSPAELRGLILLGSDAANDPAYAEYMAAHARDLHDFVDRANVLMQMAQTGDAEPNPPFLPTTHRAQRADTPVADAGVTQPDSPLLFDVARADGRLAWRDEGLATQTFASQSGFEVILAGPTTSGGYEPLLMEGAYGQGRIILSALDVDRAADATPSERQAFAAHLFGNLLPHVQNVCMRSTEALRVTPTPVADAFTPGSWKLAVMPDTQVYALSYPGLFTAQTAWIASNAEPLDIRYAIHLGDIVNNNTPFEWAHARTSMSLLDGHVPYALVPGNHDYGPSGDASTRDTLLNDYFPFATAVAMDTFGGAYEEGKLDNTYHLFSAGGRDFIIIALEWGPREEVIGWANDIMDAHPDRDGIFVTHAYLNYNDRRYDHTATEYDQSYNPHYYKLSDVNDGEELWQKLVRRHNFVITLNGHVLKDGVGYLVSETDTGTRCHQMLSNYQTRAMGGEGYMRILEFLPDGATVNVFTYSALYDDFLREPKQGFSFEL